MNTGPCCMAELAFFRTQPGRGDRWKAGAPYLRLSTADWPIFTSWMRRDGNVFEKIDSKMWVCILVEGELGRPREGKVFQNSSSASLEKSMSWNFEAAVSFLERKGSLNLNSFLDHFSTTSQLSGRPSWRHVTLFPRWKEILHETYVMK